VDGRACLLHLFFEDEHSLGAGTDNGDDLVACLEKCLGDGQNRCNTDAAAHADNGAELFNMTGFAERADDIEKCAALLELRELLRGCAHFLEDNGDGALLAVIIRYCQGDTLCHVIAADDDKLAGLYLAGQCLERKVCTW